MKQFLLFLFFSYNLVQAQVSTSKNANNDSSVLSTKDTAKVFDIRERLVQLALNNPSYEMVDRLSYIASYQLHIAKGNWLGMLSAQGNLNEFTITDKGETSTTTVNGVTTTTNTPNFYPRYNFALTIPLDIFTKNANTVKIARQNLYIAQAQRNDKFRQIKAEVLTKYEDYLLAKQKLELQSQITADAYTSYQVSERDYRLNVIKADDFNKSYRNWAEEQVRKLELQRNLNVSKIDIERLIGMKLDDVLRGN